MTKDYGSQDGNAGGEPLTDLRQYKHVDEFLKALAFQRQEAMKFVADFAAGQRHHKIPFLESANVLTLIQKLAVDAIEKGVLDDALYQLTDDKREGALHELRLLACTAIALGGWEMIRDIANKHKDETLACLLYTSPSPRDKRQSRMPSSA